MASVAALYSQQVLALATSLADFPLDPGFELRGMARSSTCGSTVETGLELSPTGSIERIGIKPHACAIGQAAAAIFAQGAIGASRVDLVRTLDQIAGWLGGSADLPDWPGFMAIAPARDFPGRHGAIPLAWRAALEALSTGQLPR